MTEKQIQLTIINPWLINANVMYVYNETPHFVFKTSISSSDENEMFLMRIHCQKPFPRNAHHFKIMQNPMLHGQTHCSNADIMRRKQNPVFFTCRHV